jgi:hypothetical protein
LLTLLLDYNTLDITATRNGSFTTKHASKEDLPASTLDGLRAAGFRYEV